MKKQALLFLLVTLLAAMVGSYFLFFQKEKPSPEIKTGEISVDENNQKAEKKITQETLPQEEIASAPTVEKPEPEKENPIDDLNPSKTGTYEYMRDDKVEEYPWVDHNGKRYYKQFGVFSMNPVNRTVVIGTAEEGKSQYVEPGMEYVGHAYTDELILSQNMHLSCYYVYSTKQLKYTKLENIIKDKEKVVRAGIYRDYYNNPDDDIPVPDNLSFDFLKDAKEIPFAFDSQLKPVEGAIDSLIFFDMGDGLVYSYRAYYKDKQVYLVDILYEKMYQLENVHKYDLEFMTNEEILKDMPPQFYESFKNEKDDED